MTQCCRIRRISDVTLLFSNSRYGICQSLWPIPQDTPRIFPNGWNKDR